MLLDCIICNGSKASTLFALGENECKRCKALRKLYLKPTLSREVDKVDVVEYLKAIRERG